MEGEGGEGTYLPTYKGYRRKTRKLLTADKKVGLSRLLVDYQIGQRIVIDIDPSQHKGMPHRRFQGKVGIIKEIRRRSVVVDVPIGNKVKTIMVRFEHVKPLQVKR
jgi:large subunit ribosomal protein L21e